MAAITFRQFIQPDILTTIAPERLRSLLSPHQEYLVKRGLVFPEAPKAAISCTRLSAILAEPDDKVPSEMVDALYFISAMTNTNAVDDLMAAAKSAHPGMEFNMDASDADIIVQIWIKDPDLVTTRHAESLVNIPKAFEYFRSRELKPDTFSMPDQATLNQMEVAMNHWFERNRRGRNCRIITADHGNNISFLIRHGMPMLRRRSIRNDKTETILYRPEVFDVAFYDRSQNELGIRAMGTKGEKNLYRETIGYYLFDNYHYFKERQKITLNPLEIDGVHSLVCSDINGLEQVTLTAINNRLDDGCDGYLSHRAKDVFLSLQKQKKSMPPASTLTMAVFSMKLAGIEKPRTLTIQPPNRVTYQRDDESIVADEFLDKRGFIDQSEG